MPQVLEFDPSTHIYRLDGTVIPSVTEVLRCAGLADTSFFTEQSAWRGTAIHLACQLDDERDLNPETVDESIRGELEAWRKLKREMNFIPYEIEVMRHGKLNGMPFAGTPDRFGRILTYDAVIDLKSGPVRPEAAIQLAAYGILVDCIPRAAIRLKPDGNYSIQHFQARKLREDRAQFGAALGIWWWARKGKIA